MTSSRGRTTNFRKSNDFVGFAFGRVPALALPGREGTVFGTLGKSFLLKNLLPFLL